MYTEKVSVLLDLLFGAAALAVLAGVFLPDLAAILLFDFKLNFQAWLLNAI